MDRAVWEASKAIAAAVSDADGVAEMGQGIMDALDRMVGCDLGSILTVAPGEAWAIVGQIADNRFLQQNYWRFSQEMSPDEVQGLGGGFTAANDVFVRARRERLSVYREFLHPNGLTNVIAGNWVTDGRVWAIGLARKRPTIPARAVARLNAVLPHLKAALRARTWRGAHDADYPDAGSGGPWALTPAQERTMSLVVRGLTNGEVAGLLGVSPHTVRNTLAEVFKKVGVSRRSELSFIVRSGVHDPDPSHARDQVAKHRQFVAAIAKKTNAVP